jgi:hypothetical protein
MHARNLQLDRPDTRALFAMVTLFVVGLAGCATELTPGPASPSSEATPYIGVFTGEFVDGQPLYRLPTIEVVGSRRSVADVRAN